MPYTQSQLRCLNTMGIVPWIERSPVPLDAVQVQSDAVQVQSEAVQALPDAVQAQSDAAKTQSNVATTIRTPVVVNEFDRSNELVQSADTLPPDSASGIEPADFLQTPLQTPLLQTPLVEIPFRGKICTQLGKSDALLLILVEASSTQQDQYPFESADAIIFEDMLRAIAWRRQDVCLGVLPPSSVPSVLVDNNAPLVRDLCKPHRDAVLLFRHCVPETSNETSNVDELIVPLERAGMLAWQLPHPALLRESPERKRQAWNVLKAARARLN